jgi:uncharacterized membrane protein YdfJ with MMPL/SSD domain
MSAATASPRSVTERLATASARQPWRTVAAWVALVVVSLAVIVFFLGDALTTEGDVTTNPESKQADALIAERFVRVDGATEVIVVRSQTGDADEPAFRAELERILSEAQNAGAIPRSVSIAQALDRATVSADGRAVLVPVAVEDDEVESLAEVVKAADDRPGIDAGITGQLTADADFEKLSQEDLQNGELFFGAPAALVILLLVFGAVVAGLVPIILALVSIVVAIALTSLLGQAFDISFFVVNMITGMGLALGIDYSLFILSRYREERANRLEKAAAIAVAGATASRAVLVSGAAFVLAMIGMVLVPDTILRSLAIGAILVGIVSATAALTLLPAVLSLLGDRVNALRVPIVGRSIGRSGGAEGRFWSAIVHRVVRRPLVSLVLSAGLLVALAIPVLDLDRANSGISTLPNRFPSKQGLLLLGEEFPGATTEPARIVIDGDINSPDMQLALGRLTASLEGRPPFGQVEVETNQAGDLAVVSVSTGADANSAEAVAAVRELRAELIPEAFARVDATVLVSGDAAEGVDYFDLIGFWLPIVFVFVLGLSFVLLVLAFRSIIVPAIAVVLNLLSVGAAYGLLVLVFQKGYLADAFGFQQVDAIEAWVPLFLFAVLFGLSMDYQVLLLSRIKERFQQSGETRDAVISGVSSTARLITGAALIIVAVFCGFAAGDLAMFQQMGFGVAVALLIDATIVRAVLMPAALALVGDRAWYLPHWLAWLPRMDVEGTPPARARS